MSDSDSNPSPSLSPGTHSPQSSPPLSGPCDGCGKTGVDLFKVSLGKDFFSRTYDRLSHSGDLHPKWFCAACSLEKGYQRDVRAIHEELDKLLASLDSLLQEEEVLLLAISHVRNIENYVKRGRRIHLLLPPREVGLLLIELQQAFLARFPGKNG